MSQHEMDARLRTWARSPSERPAPADLRMRVLQIPTIEPRPAQEPRDGRSFDMLSAVKLVAAAAVVALFAGFLVLGLLSTQPTEQPAPVAVPSGSPTSTVAPSHTPAPNPIPESARVEVPEDHFAITFPHGWTTESRPLSGTDDAAIGAFGTSPDGTAECVAHYDGDIDDGDRPVSYIDSGWNSFMERWAGHSLGGDEWPEDAGVIWEQPIPAGPAAVTWNPGEPLSTAYFVTDGYGVYRVACGPGSADDPIGWLPIAQTLELFRAERAPNGELVSGPPLTTDFLLGKFNTEQVEPGVYRIAHDNWEDLTGLGEGAEDNGIIAAANGGMWRYSDSGIQPFGGQGSDFGGEPADNDYYDIPWPPELWHDDVQIGPGDTIWAIRPYDREPPQLRTLDHIRLRGANSPEDSSWHLRRAAPPGGSVDGVSVQPDGSIWSWWSDAAGTTTIARLEGEDWRELATLEATFIDDEDDEDDESPMPRWPAIAIQDGSMWALTGDPVRLLRHDGDRWQEQPPLPDPEWVIRSGNGGGLVVGPTGEAWVETQTCEPIPEFEDWLECRGGLARFAAGHWTMWDPEQGPPQVPGVIGFEPGLPMAIGPDGRAWFTSGHGAIWFDGDEWGRVGPRMYVYALEVAPDGAVWINAGDQRRVGGEIDFGPTEYYVIQLWA
jgi:hypothetical protein